MLKIEKPIKIAFVIWSLAGMGGSERVVYDIVRKIDKRRFSIIVISFEDGPVRKLYEKIGVKVISIVKEKKIDQKFVKRLRNALLDEDIDIVNPHHFGPFLYSFIATMFSRIRLVYTEHSRWQMEKLPFLKKIMNRIMLNKSDAVVAVSNQIREYYVQKLCLPRYQVHLINNGIEISAFQNVNYNQLRSKLGIGKNWKVIGIVANIRPEKNHQLLITAFSELMRIENDVCLLIIGQDYMDGYIQSLAHHLGISQRVLFLGKREDVPDLLNIFDIFCLASFYEGLPLTILEAMAAGIPVVGADVLGINEVIKHNENGLLFPSNDKEKLTETLLLLLRDDSLRHRLSSSGKDCVERHYSLPRMVDKYEHLFSFVLQNSKPGNISVV